MRGPFLTGLKDEKCFFSNLNSSFGMHFPQTHHLYAAGGFTMET